MSDLKYYRRFISILSDYGFKVTFGNESDTLFLRKSIQALINSDVPIVEVELSRNEISGDTAESGGGLYDVSCKDEAGNHYIVEMQVTNLDEFLKRSIFYTANRYTSMIRKGKLRFKKLKKIYMISILNGTVYPNSKEYHHIGLLRNQHNEIMSDRVTHVTLELSKWNKQITDIQSDLDKLIYFMKATHEVKITDNFTPPAYWSEEWIDNTLHELEFSKMSPEQREHVERQLVKIIANQEYRKEHERMKEDILRLEQKTNNSIKRMLERGTPIDEIVDLLDVSEEEILKIKEEIDVE